MNSLVLLRFVLALAITETVVLARPADMGLKIKRSIEQIDFKPTELQFLIEMRNDFEMNIEGCIDDAAEDETFETNFVFTNTVLEDGSTKYVTEYCNITLKKMKVTVLPAPIGLDEDSVYEFEPDGPLKDEPTFLIKMVLDEKFAKGFLVTTTYKDMDTNPMTCSIENFNDLALTDIRFGKGRPSIKSVSFKFDSINSM